jgi:N-acetylneuraminic acid mutarotase
MPDQLALRDALRDLVDDVEAGADLRRRIDRRPRRNLVLVAAAAVLVVALVGAVLVAVRDRQPSKVISTPDRVEEGWRDLAPMPLSPRVGAAVVWTGKQLLVWGGGTPSGRDLYADGAVYDPATDEWRPMAPSPIGGRQDPVAAWTGEELLVWSGGPGFGMEDGGAAYDAEHDRWRRLPPAPIPERLHAQGVWTGKELVVWGGSRPDPTRSEAMADGAAYDPATDEWRTVRESPLSPRVDHRLTWTGSEVLIWGGATGDGAGGQALIDGASYDPSTDTWGYLPGADVTSGRMDAVEVWTGSKLVVWGGYAGALWQGDGATYDPRTQRWERITAAPPRAELDGRQGVGVWGAGRLYTWPDRAVWEPDGDYWTPLPEGPVDGEAQLAWTGRDLLVVPSDGTSPLAAYRPPPHPAVERTGPACGTTYDRLAPTYLPTGWSDELRPGTGNGAGEAIGHWAGGPGQRIELWPAPGPWPLGADTTRITVLQQPADLGAVHDGLAVETSCGFELVGYGITASDLGLVAEGLVDGTAPFGLWPAASPSEGIAEAQRLAAGEDPWRADPVATAEHFVAEVLGWTDVQAASDEPGVVRISHDGRTDDVLLARNVAGRWWSVTSLQTFAVPDGGTGSASFTTDGASIRVPAVPRPFATSEARFWRGPLGASVTGTEPGGSVTFDPPRPTDSPGSLLLLLKDAGGRVVDAWGFTIGSGPFAAG